MNYNFAQLMGLWIKNGGSKALAPLAAGIGIVESDGDPRAHNPSGASGIWQIEIPINAQYVPGGAGNVYDANANARAAVLLSKNSYQGLHDNWLVDEPAGAAQAIAAKNGHTVPAANVSASSSGPPGLSLNSGLAGNLSMLPGMAFLGPLVSGITGTGQTVGDVATGVAGIANDFSTVVKFSAALFRPQLWVRVGAFFIGILALLAGIFFFGKAVGVQPPQMPQAMPIPV